jgi:hypothetical protein
MQLKLEGTVRGMSHGKLAVQLNDPDTRQKLEYCCPEHMRRPFNAAEFYVVVRPDDYESLFGRYCAIRVSRVLYNWRGEQGVKLKLISAVPLH